MKKAYSMMELIFVIVIIGILASVAAPKLFVTKDDAVKAQLLNTIQEIKKGIEAYAASEYIDNGVKKYPDRLCKKVGSYTGCPGSKPLFENILQTPSVPRNGKHVGWDSYKDDPKKYVFFPKNNSDKYYAFSYEPNTGEFKCDSTSADTKKLPCSDLGM
ncbi:type II secretion system protein [Campylobacter canadensis]|uniref:Type II secretion system protein n=1 Tax=Campylobacter canadensis TaxID=449520 RepID=A0ABS7WT22_9BACT|nr:type II secretion system protein [Campylobacter canadensis]MBZ7987199.1 type II secretion system protein [Campylobacter canadensis]MBZ7996464.1 type II secretion system protein [Campylobacter canadensis]MBZ7998177.1 type II secretion system protein [Campylobacter canadensis]MBZ7999836.1 type II secretion system protein [Campylobacter canadensis]MBZ8001683.1 type II secretion system protein [Campylobacter canadensis]